MYGALPYAYAQGFQRFASTRPNGEKRHSQEPLDPCEVLFHDRVSFRFRLACDSGLVKSPRFLLS